MQRRTSVAVSAIGILLAVALLGGVSSGTAASPTITFDLTGSPPAVTPGKFVGYRGVITNNGSLTLTDVVLVESIPGIGSLKFKSFSRSVDCSRLSGGGIQCRLGSLAPHESVSFTTVFKFPRHVSPVVNTSYVTVGHDSVCANTNSSLPCAPSVTTQALPEDTTLKVGSYMGFPHSPTKIETNRRLSEANPHATRVNIPLVGDGVGVNIREGTGTTDPDNPSAPPSVFQCPGAVGGCIGQWTFVGIPETEPPSGTPFTQSNPFEVLVFFSRFEQPHGFSLSHSFAVYKNGVKVTDTCPFDAGSTVCVKSITQDSHGTIVADLLETVNGYINGGG
jgi:uncharacterized repeat protein (TIGR01451 family)